MVCDGQFFFFLLVRSQFYKNTYKLNIRYKLKKKKEPDQNSTSYSEIYDNRMEYKN